MSNSNPDPDPRDHDPSGDPRNQEVSGDEGMPAEFIDTPGNQPDDQSPPNPASLDET